MLCLCNHLLGLDSNSARRFLDCGLVRLTRVPTPATKPLKIFAFVVPETESTVSSTYWPGASAAWHPRDSLYHAFHAVQLETQYLAWTGKARIWKEPPSRRHHAEHCLLLPLSDRPASRPGAFTQRQPAIANLRPFAGAAPGDDVHLAVMPALLVDTDARPASSSDASSTSERSRKRFESASPNRPPVSPITPKASAAQLAPVERTELPRPAPPAPPPVATFKQQPPSVAISESENPDAIALRSAISILQLQREKSKQDLKALAELKTVAVADPRGFVQSIQENRAKVAQTYNDLLTPTLANLTNAASAEMSDAPAGVDARKDSADMGAPEAKSNFPAVPQPQNIVRCPPVNWAKYHIVGEPLDKMHEEQQKWPGSSEPPRLQSGLRAPPHEVTRKYSPQKDGISTGKTKSTSQTPQPPAKGPKKSPS